LDALQLTKLSHAQHCAARGGFPDVVAALLEAGADKTKLNCEGATPLDCCDASDEATAALLTA
jgi:ankyrin repeat protein